VVREICYKSIDRGLYASWQLGPYTVMLINLGNFALDGGAMFGVVPKVLWEKLIPADERNRILMATNCLLIEGPDAQGHPQVCFLDAGMGTKWSEKHRDMYGLQFEPDCHRVHDIETSLAAIGLAVEDVTQHWLTHLHFDHAGGATRRSQKPGATCYNSVGDVVPTLPNATYWVHEGDWADAHNPNPKVRASYLPENFDPLEASGRLKLMTGGVTELLPGVSLRVTGGHIDYHQILVIEFSDPAQGGLIYWGDLIPTHHHLRLPYVPAYDLYPVDVMAAKERLLKEAYEKQWLNVFEHDTQRPYGVLGFDEGKRVFYIK
jgi:glyoxylase-like metal-dependent hydrolase (beta-lactamase superfamily II)